jgi:hypothetical protein
VSEVVRPAGRESPAHELAHVIQQQQGTATGRPGDAFERAADVEPGRPVVQRRMGLEFETGLPVRNEHDHRLNYNDLVYRAPGAAGWEIKADDSNLEFVTDPRSNLAELKATMSDMMGFLKDLDGRVGKNQKVKVAGLRNGNVQQHKTYEIGPLSEPNMHAKPQATFGVPLEKLVALFSQAQSTLLPSYGRAAWNEAPEQVTLATSQQYTLGGITDAGALAQQYRDRIESQVANPSPAEKTSIDRVTGLAALVFHHLNDFWRDQQAKDKAPYAKAILTVLHRSDFRSMYNSLDAFGKKLFQPEGIADVWWDGSDAPQLKLQKMGKYKTHAAGFGGEKEEPHLGYPLDDWLNSIVGGAVSNESIKDVHRWSMKDKNAEARKNKDLMSRGAVGYNSPSMGLMGMDQDPRFGSVRLAVVEFRELANRPPLPWKMWFNFAGEMYALYKTVTGLPN